MSPRAGSARSLTFKPLTPARWPDFEKLLGRSGACGGCWCMWWRQTRREFDENHGDRNKRAMKKIVDSGEVPGILAYSGSEAVGWCSVAPREQYESLSRSRVLRPIDDEPVWSVVCFFVAKSRRNTGITSELIRGAVGYVRRRGGRIVEAYPTRPRGRRLQAVSTFMGFPSSFERAGFVECARPSEARSIMRYYIEPRASGRRRRS